jgi:hypothetical protein
MGYSKTSDNRNQRYLNFCFRQIVCLCLCVCVCVCDFFFLFFTAHN